jgi:hypothetical protein
MGTALAPLVARAVRATAYRLGNVVAQNIGHWNCREQRGDIQPAAIGGNEQAAFGNYGCDAGAS